MNTKWINRILIAIMSLGAVLRIIVWLQNRSLYIDEANLAHNVIERGFIDLFSPLDYAQFAPPLFLFLQKIAVSLGGNTEFAIRFFPLLASIISIFLFYQLCRHFLEKKHCIFPLLLFCFSLLQLKYATAGKQYAVDVCTCLFLLNMALAIPIRQLSGSKVVLWILWGSLSVWLSMPSIFVLGAVGIYYFLGAVREKELYPQIGKLVLIGACWLLSFAIYYMVLLQGAIDTDHLKSYHASYFLPLFPQSIEDLKLIREILHRLGVMAIGKTALALAWGILCLGIGLITYWRKQKWHLLLIWMPIFACFLASGFQYYSLIPRLCLFLFPILMLSIGLGAAFLWDKSHPYFRVLYVAIMAIIFFDLDAYQHFIKPYQHEELKPLLQKVKAENTTNGKVFIHHGSVPAYHFYAQKYKYKEQYQLPNVIEGKWDDDLTKVLPKQGTEQEKVWLIFTNTWPQKTTDWLQKMPPSAKQIDVLEIGESSCHVFLY